MEVQKIWKSFLNAISKVFSKGKKLRCTCFPKRKKEASERSCFPFLDTETISSCDLSDDVLSPKLFAKNSYRCSLKETKCIDVMVSHNSLAPQFTEIRYTDGISAKAENTDEMTMHIALAPLTENQ